MYDIKALEEEWKRYNRKKKRPWYLLFVVVVLTVLTVITAMKTDILKHYYNNVSKNEDSAKRKRVNTKEQKIFIDKALTKLENKKKRVLVDTPLVSEEPPVEAKQDKLLSDTKSSSPLSSKKKKGKKKLHIEVIDTGSSSAPYKEIEKRFRLGHDIDDSLFLAKSYYKKKNYKKAEYWALQTNKINENIEESWLIFAKAKAKRGQKNEAIRILNEYIKRTKSVEAKVLLSKIKDNRF